MSDRALFSCTENPILPWENDAPNLALPPQAPVWQLNKDGALQLVVRVEDLDGNVFVAPENKVDKNGIPTWLLILILASGAVVAVSVTAAVCILMRNKKTKKEN